MGSEGMVRVAHRLGLEDVHGGVDAPARDLRLQRAGRDEARARRVHQQGARRIAARSSAVTMPRVAGFRRTCRLTTSLVAKNACAVGGHRPRRRRRRAPGPSSDPHHWTRMPSASA